MWDKRAEVLSVHDGDTLTLKIDQGYGDEKTLENARLLGVWAPELKEPGGPETRQFILDWLARYNNTVVAISARTPRSDKDQSTLGRYVQVVTSPDGTENLNLAIMAFVSERGYGGGVGS